MLLYKYRSFEQFERLLDILLHGRLYCSEYRHLNDPFEGMFALRRKARVGDQVGIPISPWWHRSIEDLPELAVHQRVCSLSETASDVRMWSLYAASHTGVAIEIDFTDRTDDVNRVSYTRGLPSFLLGPSVDLPTAKYVLTCKTDHWDYEEEYRILSDQQYYDIQGRVRRVLVGPRASQWHYDLLEKAVGGNIPLVPTMLDPHRISVVPPGPITDTPSSV